MGRECEGEAGQTVIETSLGWTAETGTSEGPGGIIGGRTKSTSHSLTATFLLLKEGEEEEDYFNNDGGST